jgi:hypothetical protein
VYFKGMLYQWKSLLEKRRDKVPTGVRSLLLLNRCKTTPKRDLGLDISTVLWGMPPLFGNYCCKAVPSDQALQMTSMCCPPMVCSSNHTTCIRKGLSYKWALYNALHMSKRPLRSTGIFVMPSIEVEEQQIHIFFLVITHPWNTPVDFLEGFMCRAKHQGGLALSEQGA